AAPGRRLVSVAPQFGPRVRPAFRSSDAVSMATGSGCSSSSRIGGGRVDGSTPSSPGSGGTSPGDPGPLGGAGGGVALVFDMAVARWTAYRPSALALSAS